jgi:hypothetical protein
MPARKPASPEQIRAVQKADAEKDFGERRAKIAETLPAKAEPTAIAVPDGRTASQTWADDVAPASIVGRLVKFTKDGVFATTDDGVAISDDVDFVALVDQTLIGYIRFRSEGEPPDRVMGLLYDGFVMPPRHSLGDNDQEQWEIGLNGQPQDPWQHTVYLVLERRDETHELFTFVTSSITGRRAVGNLIRHYDRMQKTDTSAYPIVRLKIGGFQHRDERIGWIKVPVIAVVGRAAKESAAKPDGSLASDLNDQIPY